MTREEAIKFGKRVLSLSLFDETHEFCEIAVKALEQEPCEDAISREALIEALNTWDKFGYAPTNELIPLRDNADKENYVPYIHYDDVLTCIRNMPSITLQKPTTTNDSGVDTVSRKELLKIYEDRFCELQKLKHLRDNKGAEDRQLGINYCINILKEMPSVTSQPCEDAISRQAVIDIAKSSKSNWIDNSVLFNRVNKLPSITLQQRTGRWIPTGYDGYADGNPVYDWWECSECGWEHTGDEESLTAFCPNCGAQMEVEE